MRNEIDNNDFVRFLKEETFIEWKLFPTDELDIYWNDYIKNHPEDRKNILLAEQHFQSVNISSHAVPNAMRQEAIIRLKQSLLAYKRKRRIRLFSYTAAACVSLLVISVLYIQKVANQSERVLTNSGNYIVGNELESEDILFVTGDRTTTFQGNVDMEIKGNQTIQIKSEHAEDTEISIGQHATNKLIVPYGKRSEILLSDGTRVWLNSGSSLEFPSTFSEMKREVILSGEMYIEVEPVKNQSFIVHTPGYDVKVYGTKFNISAYSGSPSNVVLVEGIVSLKAAEKQELFLSPKEQAIYSEISGSFNKREVDVQSFISWKEGYLTFSDSPVSEALKQIERYYNLSFNLDDDVSLQGLTCTGKIILSDNLDNVMTALSLISATEYKRKDKLIYIYKKGTI